MLERISNKINKIRSFEDWVTDNINDINCPVYLSYGQESIAATFSELYPDAMVFPQHRGHSWYLAYGGSEQALKDELLGLPTGCSFGNGGSSDIQCDQVIAHNGLMGENAPVGCGYALQTGKTCIIQLGDGSVEEDYVLATLGFASTHNLPVIFVVEDNGLAILTKTHVRRKWSIIEVASGFGLYTVESNDTPEEILLEAKFYNKDDYPVLWNIKTTRKRWHVGIGFDEP
jgi:pyruvate dehydrogenase E1 component alpha subunit